MRSLTKSLPNARVLLKQTTSEQRKLYLEISEQLPKQSNLPQLGSGILYRGKYLDIDSDHVYSAIKDQTKSA